MSGSLKGSWKAAFFGDYHVHSSFSSDADASLDDICTCAVKIGLQEIGITDHVSFSPADPNYMFIKNYSFYKSEIERQRARFKGNLNILCGVEIDYYSEKEKDILDFLNNHYFDYYLVSVHRLEGFSLMDELFYKNHEPEAGIRKYIDTLRNVVINLPACIIAHIDWIKRGWKKYWSWLPYKADYLLQYGLESVLKLAVKKGSLLEINSSGYRRGMGEPFPGQEILACYKDAGGRYCVLGSDAHHKEEIAADFNKAKKLTEYLGLQLIAPGFLGKN